MTDHDERITVGRIEFNDRSFRLTPKEGKNVLISSGTTTAAKIAAPVFHLREAVLWGDGDWSVPKQNQHVDPSDQPLILTDYPLNTQVLGAFFSSPFDPQGTDRVSVSLAVPQHSSGPAMLTFVFASTNGPVPAGQYLGRFAVDVGKASLPLHLFFLGAKPN